MAVIRQTNWQGQMRVDIPVLRAIESAVAGDFDLFAGSMIAGQNPEIISGFYLITTGITTATNLKLRVAGSSIIHFLASESGSVFNVPTNRSDEQLNSTNPRVDGSFTPSQVNYVGVDFIRQADATTTDLVEFIDTNSLQEAPVSIPLARTVDYRIKISTLDFDNNPGIAPIAKVTVDSSGNITSVVDSRNQMFRLGSGGTVPDIQHSFPWPDGRKENTIGDTFSGGDKAIDSFKSWMDAIMTRLWEVGGGEYWYSPTQYGNEHLTRSGTPFTNGEYMEWDGSNLHWKGLTWIFSNSTGITNVIADQTTNSPGLTDLVDGECLYVDVDRTQDRTGGSSLIAAKASLAFLGSPSTPGTRYVLAWRSASNIYTRDQSYFVGASFKLATDSTLGSVKLSALTASLDNGGDPRVAAVDNEGVAYVTGLSRGGPGFGGPQGVLFGGLGPGQLTIGGGDSDTSVSIVSGGATSVRSETAPLSLIAHNGDIVMQAGGAFGGAIGITSVNGDVTVSAFNKLTLQANAVVEQLQIDITNLVASGNVTFTKNWNQVFVNAGHTTLSYITINPWGLGSKLYIRLGVGVIVNNNAGGPPVGSASILLSTSNPQRGPTTNGNSLLILYYDGTNWVEEGVF